MLALEPLLVRLDALPDDPAARTVGVYGANPRCTASADLGAAQIARGAALLAARARRLVAGEGVPALADLERFVDLAWPEPLLLEPGPVPGTIGLRNPAPASRYLSAMRRLAIDGRDVPPAAIELVNASPGEVGAPVGAVDLGAESGIYVRAGQVLRIAVGEVAAGPRAVELGLALGGVREVRLRATVDVAPAPQAQRRDQDGDAGRAGAGERPPREPRRAVRRSPTIVASGTVARTVCASAALPRVAAASASR